MKRLTQTFLFFACLFAATATNAQDTLRQSSATDSSRFNTTLNAVTVTGAKQFIVQKANKITLNVAQSPIAAGDNIYEVIKRAPGIQDQGSLRFRGKSVTVLMDGRPLNLQGEELKNFLSAMPANTIERIEVLPNPYAKYDAQGGSVINLISAKSRNLGLNGIANIGTGAGRYGRYNAGISLNYRSQKMNIYGSYDHQYNKTYNELHADRKLQSNSSIIDDQLVLNTADNNIFKLGMDYAINAKSSFGVLVKGSANYRTKNTDGTTINSYDNGMDSSSSLGQNGRSRVFTPAINLYYKTKLGKKGAELALNADYFRYSKQWSDDFVTTYFDEKGTEYTSPYLLRDNSPADNTVRSFSADYTLPGKYVQYEMGVKTVFTTTGNDIVWEQNKSGNWQADLTKSNRFVYNENINAAYSSASGSLKKFDWQLGLRMEQTNTKGNSVTMSQVTKNSYLNFFPSADVTFNQSDDQQFALSYRRKIERFGFNIVNPFIVYQNQYAYYQGNPNIKPSFSNNFEASWSCRNEWLASVSYSHYTDVLMDSYRKDPVSGAMISSYDNMNSADQVDVSVTYTKSLFNNKFTTSNTISGLYARYNAPGTTLNNGAVAAYISSQNMMLLRKGLRSELTMMYYSPLVLAPYKYKAQFSMSMGVSKAVLKDKGTITLSVSDILNTSRQQYTVETADIMSVSNNKAESRFIRVAFTWKFGNSQVKASKSRKNSISDVQSRMN